jgi:hypothetical protein
MRNLPQLDQDWHPLCTDSLFEIPTERPVICMEHQKTKEHAYYDVKMERFLSQQEAHDALRGYNW